MQRNTYCICQIYEYVTVEEKPLKKKVAKAQLFQLSVPYPAIFWRCQFFDERSEEKNHCTAGESGAAL